MGVSPGMPLRSRVWATTCRGGERWRDRDDADPAHVYEGADIGNLLLEKEMRMA